MEEKTNTENPEDIINTQNLNENRGLEQNVERSNHQEVKDKENNYYELNTICQESEISKKENEKKKLKNLKIFLNLERPLI